MPFAWPLAFLLTAGFALYHLSRKDGRAGRYGYALLGEIFAFAAVALVAVLVRQR